MAYAMLLFIPLSRALRHISTRRPAGSFSPVPPPSLCSQIGFAVATDQPAERAGSTIGGLLNISFGNTAELILALSSSPGAYSDRSSADHRLDHRHDIAIFSASRNGSDVNGRSCNTRLLCSGGTGTQRATVTEFAVLNGCGRHRLANSSPYPILIE
jgi:hypothetical protein